MSIWKKEKDSAFSFEKLNKDICTDVCVIGGGITGISTGYYLNKNNIDFCLVEKDTLLSKTSGSSTSKITFIHNVIYRYLIDSYGIDFAKGYYLSNNEAVNEIKNIIETQNIDCDFKIQDNYIFTTEKNNVSILKDEVVALNKLGVNCEYLNTTPLPLSNIVGGIKVQNQASFNPVKYSYGLLNTYSNKNNIYENTTVIDISKNLDNTYTVLTDTNYKITCKYVIMATRYPIKDIPGFYFLKMYQETSYLIAIKTKQQLFEGMYISCDTPSLSFRSAKFNNEDVLLIGSNTHKTGENISLNDRYNLLIDTAKSIFPDCEIIDKWNTQDCISLDKIPYIGTFSEFMENVYVATGFKKWGISTSNLASRIICDKIINKNNVYENIYDSTRFKAIKNRKELYNMFKQTANSMIINKFKIKEESIESIEKNSGKIIKLDGKLVGVYKDENSNIHAVSPICTHLGCLLKFNDLDKTWDCPCHGSRFDHNGKNLYGPACKDLKLINLDEKNEKNID